MAGSWAYIDGDFCRIEDAKMSILDPGFTRGDAVYDTTSVWQGNFFRLDDHVERFLRSCARARLAPPVDADGMRQILAELVVRGELDDAYVQVISTRGPYPSTAVRDPRLCINTFMAYAVPYIWLAPPARQLEGLDLVVATGNSRTPPEAVDPRVKNFNWMDMQTGLFEAFDRGGEMVVLCTPDGRVAEGPGFNVFAVRDGTLRTPRGNALEGITRRTVFEIAELVGVPCEAADLSADDLRAADEVFLSSTAGGVMPVGTVDGAPLRHGAGPGPISLRLREEYWARREAGWYGTPVASLATAG